ncbi:hypothetical protein YC2023_099540 [Brassica napus]
MIGLKELTTIPHIQEDENEKGDEVGTERDDMEKLAVVTPAETPVLLVPRVHVELHENCPIARTLHVEVLNTFERQYNVTGTDGKGYLVDLINKTCDCRHFEIDRYPCVHALAAIMKYCRTTTDDTLEQLVENYCSKYYWMEQWTLAYCRTIYPVPHHSSWEVPEEIQSQVVFPPSDKDDNDNDDIDYEESSNEGSDSEGSGDERGDNEGNDE